MDTYIMNGTNQSVPMQGTNQVLPMDGTNQVLPMQGTNTVVPMQGTNAVIPLQGEFLEYMPGYYDSTDYVVPMQGTNGETLYMHPLAFVTEEQVPMQGVPADWSNDMRDYYKAAYMYGDADAMNGLFSKIKEKFQRAHAGNAAATQSRRERRAENREWRKDKRQKGDRFIDKLGNAVGNVSEFLKNRSAAADAAEDAGIDADSDVIDARAAAATYRIKDGSGTTDETFLDKIWNNRTTGEKVMIAGGGLGVLYLVGKSQGWFNSSKGKKR